MYWGVRAEIKNVLLREQILEQHYPGASPYPTTVIVFPILHCRPGPAISFCQTHPCSSLQRPLAVRVVGHTGTSGASK